VVNNHLCHIGMYWFKPKRPINNDEEAKKVERDDRLHKDIQESLTKTHNDIQSLIKEMRQDRNEQNNKTKTQ